jgi:hypothetical protein
MFNVLSVIGQFFVFGNPSGRITKAQFLFLLRVQAGAQS